MLTRRPRVNGSSEAERPGSSARPAPLAESRHAPLAVHPGVSKLYSEAFATLTVGKSPTTPPKKKAAAK
eukprot:gene4325-4752_t